MAEREYWVGLPVGITVRDDGSITVEVDLSEASSEMSSVWHDADEETNPDMAAVPQATFLLDCATVDANPSRSTNATTYLSPAVAEMSCPARYDCGFKTFDRAEMAAHLVDPAEKHGDA